VPGTPLAAEAAPPVVNHAISVAAAEGVGASSGVVGRAKGSLAGEPGLGLAPGVGSSEGSCCGAFAGSAPLEGSAGCAEGLSRHPIHPKTKSHPS